MTVQELIERLQECPPDYEVEIEVSSENFVTGGHVCHRARALEVGEGLMHETELYIVGVVLR